MTKREEIQKQALDTFIHETRGILHISMRVGNTGIVLDTIKV